jgi:2-polyprenyl-3-methyl-5-hydroxy-6-metoxy-1,4-benzoquinol methylase
MPSTLDEYEDPHLYDCEYGQYQDDLSLYLNLIKKGRVLDLACGTGRLTIPFSQKGMEVVGLDIHDSMLTLAREKSQDLSIKWIKGDIRNFYLNQTFDLILMAGNAYQALLSDQDQKQMLDCVVQHLNPNGVFVFNTRNPQNENLKSTLKFEFWHSFQDQHGETVNVYGKQEVDPSQQFVTYITKRVWKERERTTSIKLRFTSCEQILSFLSSAGFEVCDLYGDDQKHPFTQNSISIIPVCRLRK